MGTLLCCKSIASGCDGGLQSDAVGHLSLMQTTCATYIGVLWTSCARVMRTTCAHQGVMGYFGVMRTVHVLKVRSVHRSFGALH